MFSLYITLGDAAVDLEGNQESYFDDENSASDTLLELPAFVLPEGSNIAIQCLSDQEYMEAQLFIENNRADKIRQYQDANCISSKETVPNRSDGSPQFVPVANAEFRQTRLDEKIAQIAHHPRQLACYEEVRGYIEGTIHGQMISFLTGAGGGGKSKLIEVIAEMARLHTGKTRGNTGPGAIWTPTGCAGFAVGGVTWQSALGMPPNQADAKVRDPHRYA